MFKTIIIVVFIHVCILSFVWVGFPAKLTRNRVVFMYSSSSMPVDKALSQDRYPVILGTATADSFAPWQRMRQLDRPRR